MGGAASADRTHYTADELREEVGDDLGEELEAFIALAGKEDGDGQLMIAYADIVNFMHGIPLDASMRTSRVVRVDGLIALLPAAELAAGVRAGKTATEMKRDAEFAQSRRYKDGDEVIREGSSEPEYIVECFLARGGFGDVYKVVAILKQKEDEQKRDDRTFAMKVIRLEGKDRDARARALRSLVEETHFALRVRRVAGVVPPRERPPRVTRRSSLPPFDSSARTRTSSRCTTSSRPRCTAGSSSTMSSTSLSKASATCKPTCLTGGAICTPPSATRSRAAPRRFWRSCCARSTTCTARACSTWTLSPRTSW